MIKGIFTGRFFFNKVYLGLVLALGTSCTSINTPRRNLSARHIKVKSLNHDDRLRLAKLAKSAVGKARIVAGKKPFRADCSGTVRGLFAQAQLPLGGIIKDKSDNDVKIIYRYVQRFGRILKNNPQPGDLVFFHNTFDRNRSGRFNDPLTHIGIVEKIDGSLVHFVHHLGRSIIRSRMDLSMPQKSVDPNTNKRVNHMLRRASGQHRAYTAGELFAGFGRL